MKETKNFDELVNKARKVLYDVPSPSFLSDEETLAKLDEAIELLEKAKADLKAARCSHCESIEHVTIACPSLNCEHCKGRHASEDCSSMYNGKKLRALNTIEDMDVRHAVDHAKMTGTLHIRQSLLNHCKAQFPSDWEASEFHTIEIED